MQNGTFFAFVVIVFVAKAIVRWNIFWWRRYPFSLFLLVCYHDSLRVRVEL